MITVGVIDDIDPAGHFFPAHVLPVPRKFPVQAVLDRVIPQFPHEFPRRVVNLDRAIPRRREVHPHKNRRLVLIGTAQVPGHEELIRRQWRRRRSQYLRLHRRRRGRNGERGGIRHSPGVRRHRGVCGRGCRREGIGGRRRVSRRHRRRKSIGRCKGPGVRELGRFGVRSRLRPGKRKGGRRSKSLGRRKSARIGELGGFSVGACEGGRRRGSIGRRHRVGVGHRRGGCRSVGRSGCRRGR